MSIAKFRVLFVFICTFLCALLGLGLAGAEGGSPKPPSPAEDGTLPALTAIAGTGMMDSYPYTALQELSDEIGGRVTGSAEAARAVEWGVARMKGLGLENVHAESWPLSRGWTRISAEADTISPVRHRLDIASLGWVGSTPKGGVEAEVVP